MDLTQSTLLMKGDTQPCGAFASAVMMADYPSGPPELRSKLCEAYEAPFPKVESKAGPRRFPLSLPF